METDSTTSLRDRSALVTGATSGIGFYTARRLAARGATVLVTGRDQHRGAEAANELRRAAGHERVEFIRVDHSTVAANRKLAEGLRSRLGHLDILVNNVGGLQPSRVITGDGYELTLALNFVAPFVLTGSLMPLMLAGDSARLINVISSSFTMAKGNPLDDIHSERTYTPLRVLARAKLLALVWTATLADQHPDKRMGAVAINPGMAWTPGTQALTPAAVPAWRHIWPIVRFIQRRADPDRAAASCTALVNAPVTDIDGKYFDGRKPHTFPGTVLDRDLRERVLQLGHDLANSTAG
jgi:NAD(P)-dependent dehydrogenase (short-subunit alcohol dehydrogenase family)